MFQFQGQQGNFRQSIKSNKYNKEYFLLELIGQGTEGKVYKGEEITNNGKEFVAIKVQQILNQQNIIYRFAEKKFINLINVREVITNIQGNYIIMDYADGEFYKYMQSDEYKQKQLNDKRDLFIQIVQGVEELHDMKMIHRDLKPENILYIKQQNNGGILLKLCDFGLIKYNIEDAKKTTNIGTPYYWAPEIISNQQFAPYTETVDIWALGMIWYELIVGKPMLTNFSTAQMIKEHLQRRDQNWINEQIDKEQSFLPKEKELLKTSVLVIDQTKRVSAKQFKEKLIEIKNLKNQSQSFHNFQQLPNIPQNPGISPASQITQPSKVAANPFQMSNLPVQNNFQQKPKQIIDQNFFNNFQQNQNLKNEFTEKPNFLPSQKQEETLQNQIQELESQLKKSQDEEKQLKQENQILKQNLNSFSDVIKNLQIYKDQICGIMNASSFEQRLIEMRNKVNVLESKIKIIISKTLAQKSNTKKIMCELYQTIEKLKQKNEETISQSNQQQYKIQELQQEINLKKENVIDQTTREMSDLKVKLENEQALNKNLMVEKNQLIESLNQENINLKNQISRKDQEKAKVIEEQNLNNIKQIKEQYEIQKEKSQILSDSIKQCQILLDKQKNYCQFELQNLPNSVDSENIFIKQFKDQITEFMNFQEEKTKEINQIDTQSKNRDVQTEKINEFIFTVQGVLSTVINKINDFYFLSQSYKKDSNQNEKNQLQGFIQIFQNFNYLINQLWQNSAETIDKSFFRLALNLIQEHHKSFIQAFQPWGQNLNTQQFTVQTNKLQQIYQKFKDLINKINQQKEEEKINQSREQQWESEKQQLFKTLQQLGDGNQALNLILSDFQKVHNELQQQVKSIQDAFSRFVTQEQRVLNDAQVLKQSPFPKKISIHIQYDKKKLQSISLTLYKLSTLFDQKYIKPLDNQDVKKLINDFSYHMSTVRNPGLIKIDPKSQTKQE